MAVQNLLTFEDMQPGIVLGYYSLGAVRYSYVEKLFIFTTLNVWDRFVSMHY